jgi:ABC-type uncharacterized transport system involved in gliding motility auxiliary subunit
MPTDSTSAPSFSPYRKWAIGLHLCILISVVFAVVVMVNYLSRDYFLRFHVSEHSKIQLSPRTLSLLRSLTNQVKVTLYYDTDADESLYGIVSDLLSEYRLINPKITIQTVDYLRDPALAQKTKANFNLSASTDKDLIVFECENRRKVVPSDLLVHYTYEQAPNMTPGEKKPGFVRKPALFLGEMAFTSALIDVISPKKFKAYFLQGHGEHQIDSGDEVSGYLKFAYLLGQNYVQAEPLSLLGTNTVPADCSLMVIAGPTKAILSTELEKVDQYLNQGGRLLALFNFYSINTGLERILAKWGVDVGHNIIRDPDNTVNSQDMVVSSFGKHAVVNSLIGSSLYLILPRSVGQLNLGAQAADAPRVDELAFSGPRASAGSDSTRKPPYPLMVTVEKGAIKDVITERGSTRIIVAGDSLFLANHQIDSAANRDFASCAVNWLLERTQLLAGLGPRPITQYKIILTRAQLHHAQWVLLAGLPGSVLFLGGLVWLRRRR